MFLSELEEVLNFYSNANVLNIPLFNDLNVVNPLLPQLFHLPLTHPHINPQTPYDEIECLLQCGQNMCMAIEDFPFPCY